MFYEEWEELSQLLVSDIAFGDFFGYSVSISGDYAIVGSYRNDAYGIDSGAAYIYKREGSAWIEQAKLTPIDASESDQFGRSVFINGDYAIIGAHSNSDFGILSGSAYIFKRYGSFWAQETKLLPSDPAAGDYFGWSVSINGDYAIVGAPHSDDNGSSSGSAYIFKRNGNFWGEESKLLASNAAANNFFGHSVSISGKHVIIGAYGNDDNSIDSGSAYIFKRNGISWNEDSKLKANHPAAGDYFGWSVSISGDYAIVGALYDDDNGIDAGSAYVYEKDGMAWVEKLILKASDAEATDFFGYSVSISGNYIIIGAHGNDDNGGSSGSAYIYKRDIISWTEQIKLVASNASLGDQFGQAVGISGENVVIGAYAKGGSGAAYVFGTSTPLPVELIYFTGSRNEDYVSLEWSTSSEINNEMFIIERSLDGYNWTVINEVRGKGNSNTQQEYKLYDHNIAVLGAEVVYYRLKQIDFDGNYEYSEVISVSPKKILTNQFKVNIFLNPVLGRKLNIEMSSSDTGSVVIKLINPLGLELFYKTIPLKNGKQLITLNLPNLKQGVYPVHFYKISKGCNDKVVKKIFYRN